ncbi:hypothetical protein BGX27_008192 [Mortierella sp. AM989]|nr:hypothetical protein BGX27_008192 [Mortierella sp. AM989]
MGGRGPSWKSLINNIQHVQNLIWNLSVSQETCIEEAVQLSLALQRADVMTYRLQELFIRGQYMLKETIVTLLPSIPQLRKLTIALKDRKEPPVLDAIPLQIIIKNLVQLKELRLLKNARIMIDEVFNSNDTPNNSVVTYSPPSLPLMPSKESVNPSLSLRTLDFGKMGVTARQIIEISPWFPKVQSLKLDSISLFDSMAYYPNGKTGCLEFAKDFSSAWPHLRNLTLYLEGPIKFLKVASPTDASIFVRDIATVLAPRLRILDLPTAIMDDNVFDMMSQVFGTTIEDPHRGVSATTNRQSLLLAIPLDNMSHFEQLSLNGYNQGVYSKLDSGRALFRFLESCTTLKVLDIGSLHIGSTILDRPTDVNAIADNGSEGIDSQGPRQASYYFLSHAGWACKNLQYIHLNGAHTVNCIPVQLYKYSENLELGRALFRQLSKLTQLRFLWLQGFLLGTELEKSGFHQLATLKELKVVLVDFYWIHRGTDTYRLRDLSHDTIIEFLGKGDIRWMVQSWPKLRFLNLGGPCVSGCNRKPKMQKWLDECAGPGRSVSLKEGYSIYPKEYRLE